MLRGAGRIPTQNEGVSIGNMTIRKKNGFVCN